ncbi:MAG: type IV toxin-antitoxin system AbiEi family antitoxin domain-containing protein [Propionicimonas sp.]|uniref:DUF559 domain-containing protein n=1 Tax=Propionicimonas sp. TaxID=1955623 RepID=UPI003D09DA0C
MIPRTRPPERLLRLAERQAWTLSREQVLAAGVSDRVISRLIAGEWTVLAPGVYSLRPEPAWLGWCWAGLLLAGPRACLGAAAAGHLHRLVPAPDLIGIWVPEGRQVRGRPPWVFRRGNRVGVGTPPRTAVVPTVLDLAARMPTDGLVTLLAEAVGRSGVTPGELREALAELPRHPRRRLLTELLADVEVGVRSQLERRYLWQVERAHGLPVGIRQQGPVGSFETDVWYAEYHTVVELDGRSYHDGPTRFRDYRRDNRHTEAGESTLRFGWGDTVDRACGVARSVVPVLRRNGWPDEPHDCPRCRGRRWV